MEEPRPHSTMANVISEQYKKSLLNTYTNTTQAVVADGLLRFDNINIDTGCSIDFTAGSNSVTLDKPGAYLVLADVTFNTDAAGVATIQINKNGNAINGATASTTTVIGNNYSMDASTIVKVLPSCAVVDNTAVITVANTGIAATYTNVNIIVIKLC